MIGASIQLVDMAREAARDMSDEEKIAFAVEVCIGITAPSRGPGLMEASHRIGLHAHMLCRLICEGECG